MTTYDWILLACALAIYIPVAVLFWKISHEERD